MDFILGSFANDFVRHGVDGRAAGGPRREGKRCRVAVNDGDDDDEGSEHEAGGEAIEIHPGDGYCDGTAMLW